MEIPTLMKLEQASNCLNPAAAAAADDDDGDIL